LFSRYSLSPDRYTRRPIVTWVYSDGRIPFVFSITSDASAIPRAFRALVPLKMTSSILSLRSAL